MIEFRLGFTVSGSDADENGLLKPVCLQKALMEASDRHSEELGCGWEIMRQNGVFWVVSRIRIHMLRRPLVGERLEIRTWPNPGGITGVDRNYRVIDGNGHRVAEGMARWSMVGAKDGKLVRTTEHPLMNPNLVYSRETIWDVGFERFPDPFEQDDSWMERRILPEDIDANHHVNNTRYLLFAEEILHRIAQKPVMYQTYQISFLAPLFEGEVLSLRVHRDGSIFDVEGSVLRDGKSVRSFRGKME